MSRGKIEVKLRLENIIKFHRNLEHDIILNLVLCHIIA